MRDRTDLIQRVLGCRERRRPLIVERTDDTRDLLRCRKAKGGTCFHDERWITAPPRPKAVEYHQNVGEIALLHPRAFLPVCLDEGFVLAVERAPQLLTRHEQQMLVDAGSALLALEHQLLPQRPTPERVRLEYQFHRNSLACPLSAGTTPHLARVVTRSGQPRQGAETLIDVLASAAPNLARDVRSGAGQVGGFLLDQRQCDGVRDGIRSRRQGCPCASDLLLIGVRHRSPGSRTRRCASTIGSTHLHSFAH
ncbi:MAG: hypothetical protein U5N21_11215 [Rhodococcus sp. (in: high G+C Gram-positive bacteria)]|nr:hypothetical protein [Rhodococcus sp. (in: high G+C Gram-positive bacteria)]